MENSGLESFWHPWCEVEGSKCAKCLAGGPPKDLSVERDKTLFPVFIPGELVFDLHQALIRRELERYEEHQMG